MSRRSFAYAGADTYKPGGAWAICDVCSQRVRRTDLYVRWDNLRVDIKCLDPRPPTMSIPNVYPEGIPFPDARPPQDRPDRLEDDTSLQSGWGGIQAPFGQLYPGGQNQQPGALSPLPLTETVGDVDSLNILGTDDGRLLVTDSGLDIEITTLGTPFGVNVLADDVTFITGPVAAPMNTFDTIPPQIPAKPPPSVPAPLPPPGPTPDWVLALAAPSGDIPQVALDFANGRYWGGSAVQSVTTIIQNLAAYSGGFNSANIIPGSGLMRAATGSGAVLADSFATPLLHGFTVLLISSGLDPLNQQTSITADLFEPTFTTDGLVELRVAGAIATNMNIDAPDNINNTGDTQNLTTTTGPVVGTLSFTGIAGSEFGHPTVSSTATTPSPLPNHVGVSCFPLVGASTTSYLALAAFYGIQRNADLPAMCALT